LISPLAEYPVTLDEFRDLYGAQSRQKKGKEYSKAAADAKASAEQEPRQNQTLIAEPNHAVPTNGMSSNPQYEEESAATRSIPKRQRLRDRKTYAEFDEYPDPDCRPMLQWRERYVKIQYNDVPSRSSSDPED
jgi:hypothetical protein